jgi:TolA-binding protein
MQWQAIPRFCNFVASPAMIHRVKTCKLLFCFAICAACVVSSPLFGRVAPAPTPPGGIEKAAEAALAQALDLVNNGKLPEAESAFSDLTDKYPTSGVFSEALFRLGYVQYMQEEYDQAVATLKRIASPPASDAIKTAADALVPQIVAAEAAKMTGMDRKAAFDNAIAAFDTFIQQHPNSPEVESATYGKAAASFQNQDYDNAEKFLKQNLQRFRYSESILSSEDLLAVVLTAQATDIIKAKGDQTAALGKFNEALSYLANIIQRQSDVALSNAAQYQIGEVLFDRGNAEKAPRRTGDLSNAIAAYQAVQPNDVLVALQQQRVALVHARVQQLSAGNDPVAVQAMQRVQDRENAKLEALKRAPDQTLNAQLRVAACYFLLQKYDEARVLLRYLQGFADGADQKKQIAYYMAMTYASQGIMDKAETAYNAFESAYKGDPLGENLPLIMGAAFLSAGNSEKAASYLAQERELYPGSPLVNDALNEQAAVLVKLHKYAEAIDTYDKFLETSPPPGQAAEAMRGIASIYQQTGKVADAVRQYQKVADTFPGTPGAEECGFYAAGLETTVDVRQALPMLQAYAAKYPSGKFSAQASMMIGQAQAAEGNAAAAMTTYQDVAARYAKTDFGPQAYFQMAALLGGQQKTDDMIAVLRKFIKAYPDSKDIFYAYDTIGQTQASRAQVAAAIDTYTEMADQHSDDPMAATALYRVAELWRRQAESLGNYLALNEAQRKTWGDAVADSIAAAEKMLAKYPDSPLVGVTLKTLLSDQEMLADANQKKPEDIEKYFRGLTEKYGSNPSAKSRILFTLATYSYKKDPVLGLAQMGVAYVPSLVYAPSDLDLYGSALLDQGKADQALKVYQKIARDYPVPPNLPPAQAPPAIQEAQAIALFGMANALEKEGKTADAGSFFTELKTNYPWSPKVVQANFGIARSLFQQNKFDDASKLLVGIVGSRTASASVRAHAFLLIGQIQEAKENIDAAIDSYLKTAAFYEGVADAASEGLWRGGQMLEKQASTLSEQSTPKKSEQLAKAISAYKDIVTKYPDSQFMQKAQDRLNAMGSP